MPPKKQKKQKSNYGKTEVSSTSARYRGPIFDKFAKQQTDMSTCVMAFTSALNSSAGGVIANVFSSAPNGSNDWSNLAAVWEEYRVLAWELHFEPSNRYSKTTTVTQPLIAIIDRTNGTALGSYAAASSHASSKFKSFDNPWSVRVFMDSLDEANFTPTASPTAVSYIKLYADTLSNSVNYGMTFIRWRVQFRGRA